MNKLLITLSLAALVCGADTKGTPEDEQAIRRIISEETDAFNRHQSSNVNTTEDFDLVIPPGTYAKAGPELLERRTRDHAGVCKNARMESSIRGVRFIRPDVAIVDGSFHITGADMNPAPKGLDTWIAVKENRKWRLTALRRMIPVAEPSTRSAGRP